MFSSSKTTFRLENRRVSAMRQNESTECRCAKLREGLLSFRELMDRVSKLPNVRALKEVEVVGGVAIDVYII